MWLSLGNFQDQWLMAGRLDESQQVVTTDRGCRFIVKRMAVDHLVLHKRLIQHNRQMVVPIIDQPEDRNRPWNDPYKLHHLVGLAKRNPSGSANESMNG